MIRLSAAAAPSVGRGHVSRALSLAEARWAADVSFEIETPGGTLGASERARAAVAGVTVIEGPTRSPSDGIVILDHPDPNPIAARYDPARSVVFDDTEKFEGKAAIVVQPSAPTWHGKAQAEELLVGYGWAPIGVRWRTLAGAMRNAAISDRPRVVVCFGGSDPAAVTERLGPAFHSRPGWDATIIVGGSYQGPTLSDVPFLIDPDDLPERIATADVVVAGAGTMKFEIACLGRPMLLLAVADDQVEVGPMFAATGAARYLGDGRTISPRRVIQATGDLLEDLDARRSLALTARAIIDGEGADRLAHAISDLALD